MYESLLRGNHISKNPRLLFNIPALFVAIIFHFQIRVTLAWSYKNISGSHYVILLADLNGRVYLNIPECLDLCWKDMITWTGNSMHKALHTVDLTFHVCGTGWTHSNRKFLEFSVLFYFHSFLSAFWLRVNYSKIIWKFSLWLS